MRKQSGKQRLQLSCWGSHAQGHFFKINPGLVFEKKNQENNPIHNGLKKIKYLGINLTKVMKDLSIKTTKHSRKEQKLGASGSHL
jgi:hypothetical protein